MTAACASAAATRPSSPREFGTPLYAVAEDDLRGRAREFTAAMGDGEVVFASKAFPCTAVLRVFDEEGLSVDVASGGELALARRAGFERRPDHPARQREVRARAARRRREAGARIVVDNFDELDKLERARGAGRGDDPGHAGRRRRHARRDPDRPRGLEVRLQPRAGAGGDRAAAARALGGPARACTCTSGPSSSTSSRGGSRSRRSPRSATSAPTTSAAASRSPTRRPPPAVGRRLREHDARHRRGGARPRQGALDRARPRAGRDRRRDALHDRVGQGRRPARRRRPFRRRRRGHVRQPAPDALRRAVRRRPRRTAWGSSGRRARWSASTASPATC